MPSVTIYVFHQQGANVSAHKRYAIVGTGSRCRMHIDGIMGEYAPFSELVGLCDNCSVRANYWEDNLKRTYRGADVPVFMADDFDAMIAQTKPDADKARRIFVAIERTGRVKWSICGLDESQRPPLVGLVNHDPDKIINIYARAFCPTESCSAALPATGSHGYLVPSPYTVRAGVTGTGYGYLGGQTRPREAI